MIGPRGRWSEASPSAAANRRLLEQEADEEHRRGVRRRPEHSPARVDPGVAVAPAEQPDADPEDDGDCKGEDRQLQRERSVVDDDRCDAARCGSGVVPRLRG